MTGIPGTITHMSSPDTPLGAFVVEDEPATLDPATAGLLRDHGAATMTRVAAAALLAALERDRLDAFEAATFGVDRSTPEPLDADVIATHLSTPSPAVDEAAFDAFDRATFGLTR